jgi:ubiquinone/menaquinone biosynthesis C-methylase UbiE
MSSSEREAARILAEHERRDREIGRDFYTLTKPANLFVRQGQQRALLWALRRAQALPLTDRRILEIGCGRGQWLSVFEDFGAAPQDLAGVDLDDRRLADARHRHPKAELRVGDASALPWPDESFDIVFQSTVFTSILDEELRRHVANEMCRVVRRDGAIIWYDFRYNNPRNPHVRGVTAREIAALFPTCTVTLKPVTLATPLSRRVVPRSWLLAAALERLAVLNSHLIGVLRASKI